MVRGVCLVSNSLTCALLLERSSTRFVANGSSQSGSRRELDLERWKLFHGVERMLEARPCSPGVLKGKIYKSFCCRVWLYLSYLLNNHYIVVVSIAPYSPSYIFTLKGKISNLHSMLLWLPPKYTCQSPSDIQYHNNQQYFHSIHIDCSNYQS